MKRIKVSYRMKLLSARVDVMEVAPSLRKQAKERNMSRGTLGRSEGHQPHILDAVELGVTGWEEVTQSTIAVCDTLAEGI